VSTQHYYILVLVLVLIERVVGLIWINAGVVLMQYPDAALKLNEVLNQRLNLPTDPSAVMRTIHPFFRLLIYVKFISTFLPFVLSSFRDCDCNLGPSVVK
jgi:hypothetical protein